jgi:hypothetical protein
MEKHFQYSKWARKRALDFLKRKLGSSVTERFKTHKSYNC